MKRTLLLITSVSMMLLYAAGVQAQGQYWLFHTTADNTKGNGGDKAVVGATLYKSVSVTRKTWTDSDPNNGQTYNMTHFTDGEKSQHESEVNPNNYYKVPETLTYYQTAIQWKSVDYSETVNCNFLNTNNWTEATTWDEASINQYHLNDGQVDNCVKFAVKGEFDYYVVHVVQYQQTVSSVQSTDLSDDQKENATQMDVIPGTNSNYGGVNVYVEGPTDFYFKVPKYNYFKKKKSWSDAISKDNIPSNASIEYVDWTDDKDNHLNSVNAGTYYAIGSDFHYYQVQSVTTIEWQPEEYTDGQTQYQLIALYDDPGDMVAPTEQGKYCTVGGSTYTKDESQWNEDVPATVETSWNNGTLTVGTDETRTIEQLLAAYEISSSDVTKVVFADGSTWQNGVLTTKTTEYEDNEQALKDAGFTVGTVKAGDYVTVVNGVTTITIPEGDSGVIGNLKTYSAGAGKLTKLEKQMICKATDMKLIGAFSDEEWGYLADDAGSTNLASTYIEYQEVQVQVTDENGNPVYDENNQPVYRTDIVEIEHEGAHYIHNLDLSDAKISDGSAGGVTGCTLKNNFSHVETVQLPTDSNYKRIPEQFATATQIQSIVIPSNVETIGKSAFAGCADLTTVDFSNATNLKVFEESSFEQCDITGDLVFPASVEVIGVKAFKNSIHISSVTFPKGSQLYGEGHGIMSEAFWMDGEHNDLDNVYVLEDEHLLNCDVMAFDYDNTDGQTRMSTVKTRLHYPPSLYYYYVGEWKSRVNGGVVAGHDDLLALRNLIENDSHSVELAPYSAIDENGNQYTVTPGTVTLINPDETQWVNGFQKFVSSGIPVTYDTEWRTYSDVVNLKVPAAANKVANVYIVCGFEASEEVNGGRVILKQMKEGDIIPAHTGVIIKHFVADNASGGVLSFPHVTNEEAKTLDENSPGWDKRYCFVREGDLRKNYHEDAHEFSTGIETRNYIPSGETTLPADYPDGYPNYLEFIDCKGKQRVVYNAENGNITVWPTLEMSSYKGQKVTYRNFLFGNGEQIQYAKNQAAAGNVYDKVTNPDGYRDYTDPKGWDPEVHGKMGWGFFRCKSGYYKVNSKAFLHFPAEIFEKAKGGATTAIVGAVQLSESGAKPMSLGFFADEDPFSKGIVEGGITTAIRQIDDVKQKNNEYYTVQGVKLTTPSQSGVYIHNGKKVVIK